MPRTLDLNSILLPDDLATSISNKYQEWEMMRNVWLNSREEIQRYIFATDTSSTTNADLPWKNSTHVPKLCQIRDNLNANYMATLFPNDRPIIWEGDDEDSESKQKRLTIEQYMENKLRQGKFRTEVQKCINDWIDYGNCFAMPEFVVEKTKDPQTEEETLGFVGPRLVRISPLDIVFDPTAATFEDSPKLIRSIKTLGNLKADVQDHPEMGYLQACVDHICDYRKAFGGMSQGDFKKNSGYQIDGFTSYWEYLNSGYVEIIDFYGDWYDIDNDVFYKNHLISVVDRCHIIRNMPNPSWLGKPGIHHVGWRLRPDNLYAMGPLDNLVGMQYRIDHLENAKADAFDLIIHPVMKVKGYVEDFDYGPGERIYMGDEGDVEFERPDVTMLNADTQIAMYEQKMEEMAGAPKQAMGFRTPGEKTAFEVQILENGANRVFINKTSYFEEMFMEPLLNDMLEIARRNMVARDVVRVVDGETGAVDFLNITKEDIVARGKIRPVGARHFARNANMVQNLTQLSNTPIGQDPAVNAHISGKKMAYLIEQLLDLERFGLVKDNIRVMEQFETQRLVEAGKQKIMEEAGANQVAQQPGQGGIQGNPQATGPVQ
jgi:hypothetical protein